MGRKLLIILGLITIIIAGITAIKEIDIKKIIALSTLSQLGIMIIILGIGNPILSFFLSISIIIVANISLCGLPFISGFYSKDLIIEILIIKGSNIFIFFLIIFGTILTVLYSCRLNFLVSINYIKIERYYFMSENYFYIILGIILLLPLSIIGGIIIS